MNKLGKRIRELRIKNDMSQEYVAKMLGVSPQAISKWENGKAHPEIFNLIPLSDLFHVTVDALLDKEEHHKQLEDKWLSILTSENRLESINYMKAALEEYPGDYKFRYRLANEEFFMAEEAIDPEEKRRWLALSYDHLDSMRKEFPEFTLAVDLQVRVLAAMGHRAEAIVAAKSSPNQERLLLLALEGEALEAQKKKLLTIGLLNLFADLMRFGTMQAIERAEKLLTVVAKGDRQFSSMLLELYYRKAQLCFAAGDKCGTIEALKAGQDTLRTCDGEDGNSQFGKNTIFGPLIPVKPYNELLEQFLAYISDARFHEIYNLLELTLKANTKTLWKESLEMGKKKVMILLACTVLLLSLVCPCAAHATDEEEVELVNNTITLTNTLNYSSFSYPVAEQMSGTLSSGYNTVTFVGWVRSYHSKYDMMFQTPYYTEYYINFTATI